MTAPVPIKSVRGRPAVELAGAVGYSPAPGSGGGGGICILGAEWGDGLTTGSVVSGEYGQIARIPFALSMERWEVVADASITCIIEVEAAGWGSAFASITGSEQPGLSAAAARESTILAGWGLSQPADTQYRFTLVSYSGSASKIVLGIRAFA